MKTFNLVVRTSNIETMNNFKVLTALAAFCACGALAAPAGQLQQPVPILKQVNRQNEDGSYSYGYENADGTFKIETKYPTGEVYGKYGYVDETGKLRTVEYGASSARGFEPAGTGITVPPPVWNVESNDLHRDPQSSLQQSGSSLQSSSSSSQDDYDDGQYREDPSVYYKSDLLQQQQQLQQQLAQAQQSSSAPAARQHQWTSATTTGGGGGNQKASAKFQDSRHFQAHPSVHNFDPLTGSFSISYSG